MSLLEGSILAVMVMTFFLILVRCFGVREGRVIRQYQVGKSMTIGNRQMQADAYGLRRSPHGLLAVLADGMGRNYGGKLAGKIAVDTITEIFDASGHLENPDYFFLRSFQAANREILKELDEGRGGASVAAAVIQENRLYYALAGNIKVAVFREGHLIPVSTGHTFGALTIENIRQGNMVLEEVERELLSSSRNYNHLGQDGFREVETGEDSLALRSRDIVVLMSDGIYEGLTWRELEECLSRNQNCQAKAAEITELLNASSKKELDNASVILMEQP